MKKLTGKDQLQLKINMKANPSEQKKYKDIFIEGSPVQSVRAWTGW